MDLNFYEGVTCTTFHREESKKQVNKKVDEQASKTSKQKKNTLQVNILQVNILQANKTRKTLPAERWWRHPRCSMQSRG